MPLFSYITKCSLTSASTIFRFRSRTPFMFTENGPVSIPNSAAYANNDATLGPWMTFLLGMHAMLWQEPPIHLRSTVTVCCLFRQRLGDNLASYTTPENDVRETLCLRHNQYPREMPNSVLISMG
jgi:hypothetical protein